MLAIFFSIFSAGAIAMAFSGGDSDTAQEEEPLAETEGPDLSGPGATQMDLLSGQPFAPEADPENQDSSTDSQIPEDNDVARPPMGDDYADPLKVAEDLLAKRLIDRDPATLVAVTNPSGAGIDDSLVIDPTPVAGAPTEFSFSVTAPDQENEIIVGYNFETTVEIEYNAQTLAVDAGLNTMIQGPDVPPTEAVTTSLDEEGVEVTTYLWTKSYTSTTDITLDVEPDQIGTSVADIELVNPNDTLHFDFGTEATGNFHLVFKDEESGTSGDTSITRTAYVIETPADAMGLTQAEITEILSQARGGTEAGQLVAEVYLGEDSLTTYGNQNSDDPYSIRINDYINETPNISANLPWTSVSNYTSSDLTSQSSSTPTDGSGSDMLTFADVLSASGF